MTVKAVWRVLAGLISLAALAVVGLIAFGQLPLPSVWEGVGMLMVATAFPVYAWRGRPPEWLQAIDESRGTAERAFVGEIVAKRLAADVEATLGREFILVPITCGPFWTRRASCRIRNDSPPRFSHV